MVEGRPRKLVVAALIEEGGRYLLSKRRADQSLPNLWEFPGGKVEPGETAEAALAREIQEELGCTVRVGAVVEVIDFAYDAFDLHMRVHACAITSGRPAAVQVAAIGWFTAAEIPDLPLPPADLPFAKKLAGR